MSTTAILALTSSLAIADGHLSKEAEGAMKARSAHMTLYGHNSGILGAMAKGQADYDADLASSAAANLASLASMTETGYWIEGTDTSVEGSRAKPEIWTAMDDFESKRKGLADATAALVAAAGTDLEAMTAAFGIVGDACGACHKAYRGPRN